MVFCFSCQVLATYHIRLLNETLLSRGWRLLVATWSMLSLVAVGAFFVCLVFGMKFDIQPETISSEGEQFVVKGVSKSGQWLLSNLLSIFFDAFLMGTSNHLLVLLLICDTNAQHV
jgi:hypothetical protein